MGREVSLRRPMIEIASMLAGILVGSIVGMLPGIGPAMILLATTPLISHFDLVNLFIFYSCLISSSQYFGSVSAVVYGVAGEISSVPAAENGHALFRQGKGAYALSTTSTASLCAGIWGIALMLLTYTNIDRMTWIYDIKVLISIYLAVIIGMIVYTQKPLFSLVCMILGIALGKLGFDSLFLVHILVPEYTMLDAGLPFYAMFSGLIIIPALWRYLKSSPVASEGFAEWPPIAERIRTMFTLPCKASIVRGGIVGGFIGLVPGASYMLSSNVADRIESRFNSTRLSRLLAAESANNSAAITVLLPLLLIGIPIVFSEGIILGIAETKGFGYTVSLEFVAEHVPLIALMLFIGNLVAWVSAGVFYSFAISLYNWAKRWIYHAIIGVVIASVCYAGYNEHQVVLPLITFVIASIIGMLIPYEDSKFVLVFGFFLSDSIIDNLYRFYIMYS